MNYFVTSAEGFINGFFVQQLVSQQRYIYVLVCESSRERISALRTELPTWASLRIIPIYGEITAPNMGLSANDLGLLRGNVDDFFHFTTTSDIDLDEASQVARNILGTTNAIKIAELIQVRRFHHISLLARNQLFGGNPVEVRYDPHRLHIHTGQESEKVVQLHCKIPYQMHRQVAVSGVSRSRNSDSISEAYCAVKTIH